ncbi:putative repeat protein (TIGR01451 family) [Leifsonia sp. 115AMFTsu3.1]|nr:putative repeat protein (TIGR01451 family) [Leifsonia sp. 115AMFTsu3.1]
MGLRLQPFNRRRRARTDGRAGTAIGGLRSRRIRSVAALVVSGLTLAIAAGGMLIAAPSASAAPGSPGTPGAPTTLWSEGFSNSPVGQPSRLNNYVGTGGMRYTASPYWLSQAACNGTITAFNDANDPVCGATGAPQSQAQIRQVSYALGQLAGAANPAANKAVSTFTGTFLTPDDTSHPNEIELATTSQIALPSASGRFLTFSVDAAAQCSNSPPLLRFYYRTDAGAEVPVSQSAINPCTAPGGQNFTTPASTDASGAAVGGGVYRAGSFAANGSYLATGQGIGIVMRNEQTVPGSRGNDGGFDNIRILDVTPQLDKSFSPAIAPTGGVSTLTFTVTNTSDLAAKNGWSFTDALPSGLTVASPSSAATTCPSGSVTAAPGSGTVGVTGNLAAGMASCTVTVNVTSASIGSFTNGPDNVTTTGLDKPGNATVTFEAPALSLMKHAATPVDVNGNGITDTGDTIQYTFTVTNTGDVPVSGIVVNDSKVPAIDCPSSTLAPGASQLCTAADPYTVTAADAQAGSVDNTATVTGTSPAGETVTSSPSSTSTPAEVAAPALSLVKSADPSDAGSYQPGQVIAYNFVVTNTGNITMNGIAIDETAFSGTGSLPAATCPVATLAPGEQEICTTSYTLTQADVDAGSLQNTATATGTPQGSTVEVPSEPSTVTIPQVPAPGLSIVKSATPGTVTAAGQQITYSFVVKNTGNVTLHGVVVDDSDFSGTGTLGAIDCPTTTLVAGQVETCTADYTVTQADVDTGTLTNSATVTGTPPTGDPVPPVPSNPVDITIPRAPTLSIVKTANVQAAAVGQTITYTFVVKNTGNVTITDPQVSEGSFSGTGTLSAIDCPQGSASLAPGDTFTCTADYTLTQADVDAGKLTNTATAIGTPPPGTDLPPVPPSTSTVTTDPHPALALVKTADTNKATAVGQIVTYTFTVTNIGNITITQPSVKEGAFTGHGTLSKVTCPSGSTLRPGDSLTCTATYTVVAADLTGGTLSNTATATGTLPNGDPLSSDPSTATVQEVAVVAAGLASTGSSIAGWTGGIALMLIVGGAAFLLIRRLNRSEAA